MKVYLKLNGQYFTGKLSAKNGELKFVLTDKESQAREWDSVDSAVEYLNGWGLPTKDFVVIAEMDKEPRKFCEPLPPKQITDNEFSDIEKIMLDKIRDTCGQHRDLLETERGHRPTCTRSNPCEMIWAEGVGWLHSHPHDDFARGGYTGESSGLFQEYRPEDYARKEYKVDPAYNRKPGESFSESIKRIYPERLKTPATRTITEICKQADSNRHSPEILERLYREVDNGTFEKHEKDFALEHIKSYHEAIRAKLIKENTMNRFNEG